MTSLSDIYGAQGHSEVPIGARSMVRSGRLVEMRSRCLAVHAWVVGAGWFVLAFVALVLVLPSRAGWVEALPPGIQGAGLALLAVVALPLAWPAYIAIGWYEGGLAERIRRGDATAAMRARAVLLSQMTVFAVAAIAAGAVAIWARGVNGSEYLTMMWLPLVVIAAGHWWTARTISRRS